MLAALLAVSVFLALAVKAVEVEHGGGVLSSLPRPLVLRAWEGAAVPRVKAPGEGRCGVMGDGGGRVEGQGCAGGVFRAASRDGGAGAPSRRRTNNTLPAAAAHVAQPDGTPHVTTTLVLHTSASHTDRGC